MRVDLHPLYNVNITLSEFFNVDLEERGYYHVRIAPKQSNEFLSLDIVCTNALVGSFANGSIASLSTSNTTHKTSVSELLPAFVQPNGTGVSRTVEVTYIDEKFTVDDSFTISAQLNATTDFTACVVLNVDFEIWFMDRYRPPRMDLFEMQARRSVQITLDPTRVSATTRPIYFDCCNVAAITICTNITMVSILPRRRKPPPDSPLKPKLRNYHKTACLSLLSATNSIEQFIAKNSRFLSTSVNFEPVNIQEEMKSLNERLESSERPWATLEAECVALSARLTTTFHQMLQLFFKCQGLNDALFLAYDKWRRGLLGEAFFYVERSKDEIVHTRFVNTLELLALVTKGKYLSRLPRFPVSCPAIDCPGELCPIIFEERFCLVSSATSIVVDIEGLKLDPTSTAKTPAPTPKLNRKPSEDNGSMRASLGERIRGEATRSLRMIKARRKSADCTQSMAVRRKQVRPRTATLGTTEELVRRDDERPTELQSGQAAASVTVRSVSADHLADEAGDDQTLKGGSDEATDKSNSSTALATSSSTTTAHSSSSSQTAVTSPLPLDEGYPRGLQTAVEFIREREAMKLRLRIHGGYEGWLYSESLLTLTRLLPTFPLTTSSLASSPSSRAEMHLVVFVHGLEGSHEDLTPYRWALRQAVFAFDYSEEKEKVTGKRRGEAVVEGPAPHEKFEMAFLMSRTNQSETWADITTMAHNLLNEINEYVEEHGSRVKRISFVAHSLGGVIVRSAIGLAAAAGMQWLLPVLHTLMTINTPHLGLTYVGRHVHWGVQIVQWWKRSRSMEQLALRDALNFNESFLFSLSANQALGQFRHILLIGTPNDLFVPVHSALLEPSKSSARDPSALGSAYREMMKNVLADIHSSIKTETFIRFTTFHKVATAHSNRITGRAAHIAAVEDAIFIEKLLSISALKYFI